MYICLPDKATILYSSDLSGISTISLTNLAEHEDLFYFKAGTCMLNIESKQFVKILGFLKRKIRFIKI